VDQDTELVSLLRVVTRDVHEGPALELLVVDLQVGDGGLEPGAPVDKASGAVDQGLIMEANERLNDSTREFLKQEVELNVLCWFDDEIASQSLLGPW